jgi:soluble lytic murein transglycosylase
VKRRRLRWALAALLVIIAAPLCIFWSWDYWLEHSQDVPIRAAAKRYGVEPALVKAVVWRESRFNPRVRGRAQEIGLMQIRDEAAHEWADAEHIPNFDHEQCVNPFTNTLAGTWYLKKLLKRYSYTDDPVPFALADYNAGRGNVLKWMKGPAATNSQAFAAQIAFRGTREYIRSITNRYAYYKPIFTAD